MSELLSESQLREQDIRLYGMESAVELAAARQRIAIEVALREKNLAPSQKPESPTRNVENQAIPASGRNLKDLNSFLNP